MLLNEKLKKLRESKKMTQEGLAEKLNVSRQAITKWESGAGSPDIENLKAIGNFFEISLDELVKEDLIIEKKEDNMEVFRKEIEINHSKKFDIKFDKNIINNLIITKNDEEKVLIEVISENKIEDNFNLKIDDNYNRIDINFNFKIANYIKVKLSIPEKYINDIELKSKIKILNIENINIVNLEYDGTLKYLIVKKSKGIIVLNTTCCDIEAEYDKFDGKLEVNIINSTARIKFPENAEYRTVVKGLKNTIINNKETDNSENIVELNGLKSKLIFE